MERMPKLLAEYKIKIGKIGGLIFGKNFRFYAAAILFLLFLFAFHIAASEERGGARVYFLDVGQGDAVFIDNINGVQVLVDGGPDKSVLYELSKLMPFYDRSIDVVIATHPDSDHITGLVDVVKRYDVGLFIETGSNSKSPVYLALERAVRDEDIRKVFAATGMEIDLGGGAIIKILSPCGSFSAASDNDASIVVKFVYGSSSFLLTADATKKLKRCLLEKAAGELKSDVLKVAHHGSGNSFLAEFIRAVQPKYAVISAGSGNRYHHPHKMVVEFLRRLGIDILGTYDFGTIEFFSDGRRLFLNDIANRKGLL